ncbi:protein-disulfide reductase DsbD N-terminal domain-containing protein [Mucilaginibacter lacusdianchii]|uniref:protein-disulfide reductase DsbD N-terminal domain-containing protein n=1 Tax=Mucilaginibacter lacusdianchii TaxID=2684211 RepID=UPI00131B0614|nr:protein-disulfide reductase DsbD N-terminal domain-containing protein [Mucilaginibacter sp. JXJ CY 39]
MKKILVALMLFLAAASLKAQILTPVKWAYAAKRISKTEAVVMMRATVDDGWHIYSQHVADGGPVKTTFTFTASPNYAIAGKTVEPKAITKYEKAFGMNVSYFEHSVIFQQRVRLMSAGPVTVKGTLEYMTCNDEKCLPPDNVTFAVAIK